MSPKVASSISTRAESGEAHKGTNRVLQNDDRYFSESSKSSSSASSDDEVFGVPKLRVLDTQDHSEDLVESRDSLVKPIVRPNFNASNKIWNGTDTMTQQKCLGLRSLKSVIKWFNSKTVDDLEKTYSNCNKKQAQVALTLAELYISGRRVEHNYERAIEILSVSSLAEAKLMLMNLAFSLGKHQEAFYFASLLALAKCNCPTSEPLLKKRSSSIHIKGKSTDSRPVVTGSKIWIKHQVEKVQDQIFDLLGAKEASLLQKAAIRTGFSPSWQ